MILEEQPAKVAEALKLFLQGLGHTLSKRRASGQATTTANSKSTSSVQGELIKLNQTTKVCIIKNCTNSSADNSASRHDCLNLKGSAESGEEND